MMTLGIPGDPVTAILIRPLLVHRLAPGPMLFIEREAFASKYGCAAVDPRAARGR